jgi:hypothetical protein
MDGQAYSQATDYQIAGTTSTTGTVGTTTYKEEQYNYQYQYQMPTTTTTTTKTTKYTTTTPVTYTQQQFTTTSPVSYTEQQYTTTSPVSYTQQYTTSQPVYTTTQKTTYTTSVPTTTTTTTTASVGAAPAVKLFRRGSGISANEQNGIISTAMAVYQNNIVPLSNNTASRIKKIVGGDWLVIVYPQEKPIDFNMTCVQGNDYLYFTLDNLAYQVCRLT